MFREVKGRTTASNSRVSILLGMSKRARKIYCPEGAMHVGDIPIQFSCEIALWRRSVATVINPATGIAGDRIVFRGEVYPAPAKRLSTQTIIF